VDRVSGALVAKGLSRRTPATDTGGHVATIDPSQLPPVIDLLTAASLLGIGRTSAYELVRTNRWPTPVIRVGKLIRVPSAPLLELVGLGTVATQQIES